MGAVEIGLVVLLLALFYTGYRMCRSKKPDPKMDFLLGLIERCADDSKGTQHCRHLEKEPDEEGPDCRG
jgi:hypothetical protein